MCQGLLYFVAIMNPGAYFITMQSTNHFLESHPALASEVYFSGVMLLNLFKKN